MYKMVWDKDCLLQFIRMYKEEECLWNYMKSKLYQDKDRREQSYERLLMFVQEIDPMAEKEHVVKRIKNLRTTFRKAYNEKIKLKKRPRLWYYKELEFLLPLFQGQSESSFNEQCLERRQVLESQNMYSRQELEEPEMDDREEFLVELDPPVDALIPSYSYMATPSSFTNGNVSTQQNAMTFSPYSATPSSVNASASSTRDMLMPSYTTNSVLSDNINTSVESNQQTQMSLPPYTSTLSSVNNTSTQQMDAANSSHTVTHSSGKTSGQRRKTSRRPHQKRRPAQKNWLRQACDTLTHNARCQDRYDLVGQHVAQSLRELSKDQSIHAQKMIGDILYAGQSGSLSRTSHLVIFSEHQQILNEKVLILETTSEEQ